jgi:hypothetical protein
VYLFLSDSLLEIFPRFIALHVVLLGPDIQVVISWVDGRLTYTNLHQDDPALNQLSAKEYDMIWQPSIRFINKEPTIPVSA